MFSVSQYQQHYDVNALKNGGRVMNTEERQTIIEHYVHAYNAFDVEAMILLLHPAIEFKSIANGEVTVSVSGIDDFRNLVEHGETLFSSRKQTVMEYYEKDDQVIVEISYSGVLATDFPDGMKAGDTLNFKSLSEILFKDGKIYKITDII
jgi:ketosteroid isomerase-like protein